MKNSAILSRQLSQNCPAVEALSFYGACRIVECVSRNATQSPKLLKAIIGNGKVYQKDCDLKPLTVESTVPSLFCSQD